MDSSARGSQPESDRCFIDAGTVYLSAGTREALHEHPREGQLKWSESGVLSVPTEAGTWVAPPGLAVWIPVGQRHGGMAASPVVNRNVFVSAGRCERLPRQPCVVSVSPRLRSAIMFAITAHQNYARPTLEQDEQTLLTLEEELRDAGLRPVKLPLDVPGRFNLMQLTWLESPAEDRRLRDWAEWFGMNERTFARAIRAQVGLSFGNWRTRVRLLAALQSLALGRDVTSVAAQVGYEGASAFVAMFRRELGTTPARYFVAG